MKILNLFFPSVYDDDGRVNQRLTVHHALYFLMLVVLVGSQSVSNYMMSAMQILLAVNWALEWDMRRKFQRPMQPLLWSFLTLFGVLLLWMIPTAHQVTGWNELFSKLPLLAIPLVVLTSRPLSSKQLSFLVFAYCATVFVATIIGHVRHYLMPELEYRDIIPFISHIRFALNVCMVVVFMLAYLLEHTRRHGKVSVAVSLAVVVMTAYFLHFLLLIHSYTALIILFVVSLVMLACFGHRIAHKGLRRTLWLLFSTSTVAIALLVGVCVRDYYKPISLVTEPLAPSTANGNPYLHKQNGYIENGNLIDNYICNVELEKEWCKRSSMPLDTLTPMGYTVYPALLRYLNAIGTTKDSVGMQLLTDDDIRAIEEGIANPVYLHGSKLREMVYVMLFEYESYRIFGAVKNFSVLQRLELWRNTWKVFLRSPLFGCGTGDLEHECLTELAKSRSPLADHPRNPHNQYLSSLASFGIVGSLIIAVAFVWGLRMLRLRHRPLLVAYLVVLLISFISENTLSTLAGCVFATTFFSLLGRRESAQNLSDHSSTP